VPLPTNDLNSPELSRWAGTWTRFQRCSAVRHFSNTVQTFVRFLSLLPLAILSVATAGCSDSVVVTPARPGVERAAPAAGIVRPPVGPRDDAVRAVDETRDRAIGSTIQTRGGQRAQQETATKEAAERERQRREAAEREKNGAPEPTERGPT
jgi:hypothetical protein